MTQLEALTVLADHRDDAVVVTTMGAVGIWPQLSDLPLDFAYIPSSMGQGVSVGLGLALATKRRVIVVMGDGSLLMNLGCLVTIAQHPAPLTIIVMENGLYEVTGGQELAGAGRIDFAALARAAGIAQVFAFTNVGGWQADIAKVLAGTEATFVVLRVEGERGKKTPNPPCSMNEQISRLRGALAGSR